MGRDRGNPLLDWRLDPDQVAWVGHGLVRPECILAERDGALWTADARGGVVHIIPDGRQRFVAQRFAGAPAASSLSEGEAPSLVEGTLPNGLAFARNGELLIANFGTDALEVMDRSGRSRVLCEAIDGVPLGKVNFVARDRRERLWVTVSTRISPWTDAVRRSVADGYVAVIDERGPRVVADGLCFANEARFDADEQWLYVAETCARRVTRFRVAPDATLHGREVYGPSSLGSGALDGIAFDAFGNLWAAMIFADRLVAITPEGDVLTLFEDGDREATARFDAELDSGAVVAPETMAATGGTLAPWLTSVAFGGPDLRTVYLGSLKGTSLPSFRAPVAGLPPIHWSEG